ncbi:MAG: hypothetical protein HY459_04575 [Parcubacteria group bacterium]|nr:hypothetical protein [Parcubacteria group bacterium]
MPRASKNLSRKPDTALRPSLFWDVDPKTIDLKRHARYVIERVLDFGNDKEVRWLWKTYSRDQIREVVATSRVLHNQSRALWKLLTS